MRSCVLLLVLCFTSLALAQQPAAPATAAPQPAAKEADTQPPDAQQLITREFGKSFTVAPGIAPMYGDMDGDGLEDAVIVVRSEAPLVDEVDFHYRPIDPYDAYWGWGNPKETVQFSATSTGPLRYIAIIHNWRAPKSKFLVINLPFEKLVLSRVMVKKKPVLALHTIESSGLESDLFWDGKKYKWNPGYIN
jgi:hypothetical protein